MSINIVCLCVCVCVCVCACVQGEVLGITRFGLAKMKESVLMLASVSHDELATVYKTLSRAFHVYILCNFMVKDSC